MNLKISKMRLQLTFVPTLLVLCAAVLCSMVRAQTVLPVVVRPAIEAPTPTSSEIAEDPGAELITLNFQNIEIRALLQVMAEFTGLNMVVSDSVSGAVTLRLKDVPCPQALDIILASHGLGMLQAGNILHVAPKQELADLKNQEKETTEQIARPPPSIVLPSPLPPIDTIIQDIFPEASFTAKFKDVMDYATFRKLINFVITSKYTHKRLKPFLEQKIHLV